MVKIGPKWWKLAQIWSKNFFSAKKFFFQNFFLNLEIGQKTRKKIFGVKIRPKKFFWPFLRSLKRVKKIVSPLYFSIRSQYYKSSSNRGINHFCSFKIRFLRIFVIEKCGNCNLSYISGKTRVNVISRPHNSKFESIMSVFLLLGSSPSKVLLILGSPRSIESNLQF